MWNPYFLLDFDSGVRKFRTPTPTLVLIVWHTDCALKDDLRGFLNSSKRCTVVYMQNFNCKFNCTKVKQTAWGCVTDKNFVPRSTRLNVQSRSSTYRSRSLLQKGDSNSHSGPKPGLWGLRLRLHTFAFCYPFLMHLRLGYECSTMIWFVDVSASPKNILVHLGIHLPWNAPSV